MDTEAVSISFSNPSYEGKTYLLNDISLKVGPVHLQNSVSAVSIITGIFRPSTSLERHTTGFFSEYSVSTFFEDNVPAWGSSFNRFSFSFGFDGNDLWNEYQIPTDIDFLNHPQLVHSEINIHRGISQDIFGRINSVTATVVPIPSGLFFSGIAVLALIRKRLN